MEEFVYYDSEKIIKKICADLFIPFILEYLDFHLKIIANAKRFQMEKEKPG